MPVRRSVVVVLAALLLGAVAGGCANQQDTAARVVAESQATLDALREDAKRVAPEQYAAAEKAIAELRRRLEQRDYAGVLSAFPGLTAQLTELKATTLARHSELQAALERARAQWSSLSNDLPQRLDALQRRVDELGRSAQLPAGIDRALLERARKTLAELRQRWAEALAAASQGRIPEAADSAQQGREQAEQLARELGLQQT